MKLEVVEAATIGDFQDLGQGLIHKYADFAGPLRSGGYGGGGGHVDFALAVGEHEADVKKGKISIASPIARAMISKEVGDVVEVNTPGGVKAYEILKVEWK